VLSPFRLYHIPRPTARHGAVVAQHQEPSPGDLFKVYLTVWSS
jgi:hypothetical protein